MGGRGARVPKLVGQTKRVVFGWGKAIKVTFDNEIPSRMNTNRQNFASLPSASVWVAFVKKFCQNQKILKFLMICAWPSTRWVQICRPFCAPVFLHRVKAPKSLVPSQLKVIWAPLPYPKITLRLRCGRRSGKMGPHAAKLVKLFAPPTTIPICVHDSRI